MPITGTLCMYNSSAGLIRRLLSTKGLCKEVTKMGYRLLR